MGNQSKANSSKNNKKNWKLLYGPVYPLIEKEEMIKIPTEQAGYVSREDLEKISNEFLEISAKNYYITRDVDGNIIERKDLNGEIISKEELEEQEH